MNISPGSLIPSVYLFVKEFEAPRRSPRGLPLLDPLVTGLTLRDPIPNGLYGLLLNPKSENNHLQILIKNF